jgi:hypothetical protein
VAVIEAVATRIIGADREQVQTGLSNRVACGCCRVSDDELL